VVKRHKTCTAHTQKAQKHKTKEIVNFFKQFYFSNTVFKKTILMIEYRQFWNQYSQEKIHCRITKNFSKE